MDGMGYANSSKNGMIGTMAVGFCTSENVDEICFCPMRILEQLPFYFCVIAGKLINPMGSGIKKGPIIPGFPIFQVGWVYPQYKELRKTRRHIYPLIRRFQKKPVEYASEPMSKVTDLFKTSGFFVVIKKSKKR